VDQATGGDPADFMLNGAHPSHFEHVLAGAEPWVGRIRGLPANSSQQSHAPLNEVLSSAAGDPHAAW
jgi:homocysteine S-methyltransferase